MQPLGHDTSLDTDAACEKPCHRPAVFTSPIWLLSLLPVLVALFVCFHYGFEAPYMDQWELVPLIEKAFTGHVSFADLWAQHNVHRIPIPKFIMLVLARLSHWDTRWERVVSMSFALSAAVLLLRALLNCGQTTRSTSWAWLVIATLFFSAAQWENLLWGWHLLIYLNLLGAILVCVGLSSANPIRYGVPIGIVGATLSVFSYGNGLILLPVGFAVLALQQWQCKRLSISPILVWGIASLFIGGAYVWSFHKPSYDPSYTGAVTTPAQYAYYVAAYLGAPLASFDPRLAAALGTAGLGAYATIVLINVCGRGPLAATLPFDGLALYAVGTAFLTATARTGFGVVQALSPRYIAFSSLLWIAIVVHLSVWLSGKEVTRAVARALAMMLVLIGVAAAGNSALGVYRCDERHDGHVAARDSLITGDSPELLRRIYPDEQVVLKARDTLLKYRLNVFR